MSRGVSKPHSMTLMLTDRESAVLEQICEETELTKISVIRQALKLYQLVRERKVVLVDKDAPDKRVELVIL